MTPWFSDYVNTNGIRMRYHRTGGDKPTLVLIHGITDSGLCWTRVAQDLEADYDMILVDARGHGHSTAPESGYGPGEHAADVAGLIRALGLTRPALVGHSMGAAIAAALAATFPDRISSILLEDPPWRLETRTPLSRRQRMIEWQQEMADHQKRSEAQLLDFVRRRSPTWDAVELGPWMDAKRRVSRQALQFVLTDDLWRQYVPDITCPALLITADPELGGIVTREAAAEMVRSNHHFQTVHIPGAGHNIRREQYLAYLRVIRAFLKDVETRV